MTCETPRAQVDSLEETPSTPKTPSRKISGGKGWDTPPMMTSQSCPPPVPRLVVAREPPLRRAIHADSVVLVREALQSNPDSAKDIFFDHEAEPPLCLAIRKDCDPQIIQLLLDYGASAEAVDKHGATPLSILSSHRPYHRRNPVGKWRRARAVAAMLMSGGADPMSVDCRGKCPVELALASGNVHLVELFEGVGLAEHELAEPLTTKMQDEIMDPENQRVAAELRASLRAFGNGGGLPDFPGGPFAFARTMLVPVRGA